MGLHYAAAPLSPAPDPVLNRAQPAAPSIEILGGDPFFLPKGNERPIRGPVFPRGRGPGPLFRIQADCPPALRAWISGPGGSEVAKIDLTSLAPGSFQGRWAWSSASGWPVPEGIPVGEYKLHVRSRCHDREAAAPFYVVFDPDAAGGPARFSFDSTAVWFGVSPGAARALRYYLHCSDARVFEIAIRAASGHTTPYQAAIAIARAAEAMFGYSLVYQTNDVVDLIENHKIAQCIDDAALLTALLRAMGIPAYPVTADAGLEVGTATWSFDTWIEFLAEHDGVTEWRVLHPHEYPGMQPESRRVFGARSVATKHYNDLILRASERWIEGSLDDTAPEVRFGRSACGEPKQMLARAPWVDELCEAGYWERPHWDCRDVQRSRRVGESGFRLEGAPTYGGRLAGTVHLAASMAGGPPGLLAVELVVHRPESQGFPESVLQAIERPAVRRPDGSITLPFDFALPASVPPGRALYLRALLDERTALLAPVTPRQPVEVAEGLPRR